jgi:trigger factor
MITALERKPDGTIVITIHVAWDRVAQTRESVIAELVKNVELPGFRKGKAPRETAEKSLDQTKIYEEVIQKLLPVIYQEVITEHALRPVVTPKIEIVQAREGEEWIIRAHTAEKPSVTLGDYKEAIRQAKSAKRNKIWTPGQETGPAKPNEEAKSKEMTLGELLEAILSCVTCQVPGLLIEQDVNRALSDLIDQTKKLGLTVDQYLASTGRTVEHLRKEYAQNARRTLTLEFALEAIADAEHIAVDEDEIEKALKAAKSEEERATLARERYYLATVLRRQKTLDFLSAV